MSKQSSIGRNLEFVGSLIIGVSGVLQMIDGNFIFGMTVLGLALVVAGFSMRELPTTY